MRVKKITTRFSILGLIALLSFIGNLLIIWQGLIERKYVLVFITAFITLPLTYFGFFFAYQKLFTVISKAKKYKDDNLLRQAQTVHLLCKDPLCGRCRSFYFAFSLIAGSLIVARSFWIELDEKVFKEPLIALVVGMVLFIISTPLFGYIGRVYPNNPYVKKLEDNLVKMFCGFISGGALGIIGGALGIFLKTII